MGFDLLHRWFLFGRSGLMASPSLGGIGEAHTPTLRCSRRRETPSLFQTLLPGAADLLSLGGFWTVIKYAAMFDRSTTI